MSELVVAEHRPTPSRGLVLLHNARGQHLSQPDVLRWLRLNREGFKVRKADVLAYTDAQSDLTRFVHEAEEIDLKLSLRTDAAYPPNGLEAWRQAGLWDLFLTPAYDVPRMQPWLDSAKQCGLPVRVQFQGRVPDGIDPQRLADVLAAAEVRVAQIAVHDPFVTTECYKSGGQSAGGVRQMNALVDAFAERGMEANLVRLPFCQVDSAMWPHVLNTRQYFLDHQQYDRAAYVLAARLFHKSPAVAAKIVQMLLGRHTSYPNPVDSRLLPWLLETPWLRARVWAWHKLTRHRRLLGFRSAPPNHALAGEEMPAADSAVEGAHRAVCAECSMRHVCDGVTRGVARVLPDIDVHAQTGEAYRWPLHFAASQPKYYDAIDVERAGLDPRDEVLARDAAAVVGNTPPTREITSFDYATEGQWSHQMQGGVRWHSFTNTEKRSTTLAELSPPFTLSATFGGGIAESIGFSVGRLARIMCPMTAFHHTLILHVDDAGRYVLLRDGHPVRPLDGSGGRYAPTRLGARVDVRLALDNIDGTLVTQSVTIWEKREPAQPVAPADYSVVIVSIRYARRLQAVLQSLAHQEGFARSRLEVVIAYVPGVDSTEDVLDSVAAMHPDLRIVRAPFAEELTRSKGFLINEACKLARGEWVILLDSDILVPPDLFRGMDALPSDCTFAAPNGRKMLAPEVTAKILLGEIRPWEQWQELLKEPGEFRYREVDGMPIGFFQAVRRACLETVRYEEYEHFEGADWGFGKAMRDAFGKETRLSGHPVIHLDHGGSKWYGTKKHF